MMTLALRLVHLQKQKKNNTAIYHDPHCPLITQISENISVKSDGSCFIRNTIQYKRGFQNQTKIEKKPIYLGVAPLVPYIF